MGCEIVRVYKDHGVSGSKGRDGRPEFDRLIKDAAQRKFDMVMAWSVDRLGRSLHDLVGFLKELHAPCVLTCFCTNRASIRLHRPVRPCSK
jgi:DNA invertase Pin-like site-specific DNA recombinase